MKNFWKIYSWIYLIVVIYGIFYDYSKIVSTIPPDKMAIYNLAYILKSIPIMFAVVALFLYAYSKNGKFILFWKFYFIYFLFNFIILVKEMMLSSQIFILLPFHIIATVGLFIFAFGKKIE